MKIDRANKNWNKHIPDEEIFNEEYSIGYLLQSNLDFPGFSDIADTVFSTYKVRAKFQYLGFNGDVIYANGQKLIWRKDKFSNFSMGKDVSIIYHNLSYDGGGSNKYPSVSFEGAFIEIEFISYGLPFVDKTNGWSIEIKELTKI